ncbi:MAG: aspartate/glutamate racemase family protein [Candidatus Bathyarchaeia archaeon]
MYGWRGRIGLLVPATNTVAEMEFHKLTPQGVSVHTARIPWSPEHINTAEEKVRAIAEANRVCVEAAKSLADITPNVVVYACTTGSFFGGRSYEKNLVSNLAQVVKCPVITATHALVTAVKALKAKTVTLVTPYLPEITALEKEFLENEGIKVIKAYNFVTLASNIQKGGIHECEVYKAAKGATCGEDVLILSCTNMATLHIIDLLEKDLGHPVISSNQAAFWLAMQKIKISPHLIKGYGYLFERLAEDYVTN